MAMIYFCMEASKVRCNPKADFSYSWPVSDCSFNIIHNFTLSVKDDITYWSEITPFDGPSNYPQANTANIAIESVLYLIFNNLQIAR